MRLLRLVASPQSAALSNWLRTWLRCRFVLNLGGSNPQTRSRVIQTEKMKAAINPTTTSIQFWTSKPRNVKPSTRNRTAAHPVFRQAKHFCDKNILFLYSHRGGAILPIPDMSGVGARPPWRGTRGTKRSAPAKELLWLILFGDERPDMSR